jgi:hypothetical protein
MPNFSVRYFLDTLSACSPAADKFTISLTRSAKSGLLRLKMTESQHITQVIIQVEQPGRKLDMPAVRSLLEDTGVELDGNYGPILVNDKLGRYVVRGKATSEARAKAEQIPGVRFFADIQQKPISGQKPSRKK